MSTDNATLFEDEPLEDILRRLAERHSLPSVPTQPSTSLDEYSLVEIAPEGNGRRVIALQNSEGEIFTEASIENIEWDDLTDNTADTYRQFLQETAENPGDKPRITDFALALQTPSPTSEETSQQSHTTHFDPLAQQFLQENGEEMLAELLEGSTAGAPEQTLADQGLNIESFDLNKHRSQLEAYIAQHAPTFPENVSSDLLNAVSRFTDDLYESINETTTFADVTDYLAGQFTQTHPSTRRNGVAGHGYEIVEWAKNNNIRETSMKGFTSGVRHALYHGLFSSDQDEINGDNLQRFLHGSNDWVLLGTAEDYLNQENSQHPFIERYEESRDTVQPSEAETTIYIANGAAFTEAAATNQGSRQVLRQLMRRNWLHDEYRQSHEVTDRSALGHVPGITYDRFKRQESTVNHVAHREKRYVQAIGLDTVENKVGELGSHFDKSKLLDTALNMILDGVRTKEERDQVFTRLSNNQPLVGPETTAKDDPRQTYLVRNIGAQILTNAAIRAYSDRHTVEEALNGQMTPE